MVRVFAIVFTASCIFFHVSIGYVVFGDKAQEWNEDNVTRNNPHPVRSMLNLYSMIECATECKPWKLAYYGNYCGLSGSGIPINDIDSCCEQHDACYNDNTGYYGCSSDMYLSPYGWSCKGGYPYCHDGHDKCGYWTCVCDKAFVECLNDAGCP